MIENKQVNLWRGPNPPPTLYHIWLKDESQLLRYDEETQEWTMFLDSKNIGQIISNFMDQLDTLIEGSVNGYPIKNNPVLNAADLLVGKNGHYFSENSNLQQTSQILDELMTTQVL